MKSPMSCKICGENVSYFRLVLIHSNSCTFSWFRQNLKNVLKSWNFSCKKYFFKFSDFRPFLLQKYVTAQNLLWKLMYICWLESCRIPRKHKNPMTFELASPAEKCYSRHRIFVLRVMANCLTNRFIFFVNGPFIPSWLGLIRLNFVFLTERK